MRPSTSLRFSLVACVAAVGLASVTLVADDKPAMSDPLMGDASTRPAMAGTDQAAMMAAWQKYATPGPEHAELATWVGEWDLMLESAGPDMPPERSTGTAKASMIMGGRYLMEEVKGTSMGMPFEGMALTAFDNKTEQYLTTWIDSMGTGIATSHGPSAGMEAGTGKTMNMTGEMTCPMDDKPMQTKTTIVSESDDKRVMDMAMTSGDGKPMGTMRITYVRKK